MGCKSPALGSQTPSSVTSPTPPIKQRLEKAECVFRAKGSARKPLFQSCNFPAESVCHANLSLSLFYFTSFTFFVLCFSILGSLCVREKFI